MKSVYDVIKRPVISEKSTAGAEAFGTYAFEVAVQANKEEIRDAVQRVFSVKVKAVRTMTMQGKHKRFGRGALVKRANWKKAIVTLEKGQKIEFFEA
ncbi:MAG: 50S ribosomal protein L23 [Bdellovibrionales bacterium]|nr:50S ribosomal protein L23 [Bdellovibrionales bacterium]